MPKVNNKSDTENTAKPQITYNLPRRAKKQPVNNGHLDDVEHVSNDACLPEIEVHSIPNIAANVVVISEQTDLAENEDATVAEELEIIASNNESHIDGIEEVNLDALSEEPIPYRSLTDDEIRQIDATIDRVINSNCMDNLDEVLVDEKIELQNERPFLSSKRKKTSWVWNFFNHDEKANANICVICGVKYDALKSQGSNTAMEKHLTGLKGGHGLVKGTKDPMKEGNILFVPFSQENVRRCIAHWITMSDIPFSEIENPFFKQMMLCASDNQYKPVLSRSTVRDDIEKIHTFIEVVENQFELLDKILVVTTDSASSNYSFMRHLSDYCKSKNILNIHATGSRISCFAHILNLAVQAFLKAADIESPADDDYFDVELEEALLTNLAIPTSNILKKLRRIVVAIRSSGQRRELFKMICDDLHLEALELIIDCATRWNSACAMIERGLRDWEYLNSIYELLKDYKITSEAMGNTKYPTISQIQDLNWNISRKQDGLNEK
uniref:BED-type domain-containing protein n=1 Tax=Daphnia galeata TaxID=27404 RepID=A0A8J2RVH1_9CRUS|nr:unnamed protein product [Daphnia galeata]